MFCCSISLFWKITWGACLNKLILNFFFLPALGLHCCAWASSSCGEWGYSSLRCVGFSLWWPLVAEHGLQTHGLQQLRHVASVVAARGPQGTWASVVAAHGLSNCGLRALEHRLSSCGAWTELLCGMWDLPGPGIESVSPALAGGFLTTAMPGKSPQFCDFAHVISSDKNGHPSLIYPMRSQLNDFVLPSVQINENWSISIMSMMLYSYLDS